MQTINSNITIETGNNKLELIINDYSLVKTFDSDWIVTINVYVEDSSIDGTITDNNVCIVHADNVVDSTAEIIPFEIKPITNLHELIFYNVNEETSVNYCEVSDFIDNEVIEYDIFVQGQVLEGHSELFYGSMYLSDFVNVPDNGFDNPILKITPYETKETTTIHYEIVESNQAQNVGLIIGVTLITTLIVVAMIPLATKLFKKIRS